MKTFTLFTASWCAPCKELKSWLVSNNIKLDIKIIDIDEEPELAGKVMIDLLPTLVVDSGKISLQLLEGREEIKPYLEYFNAKGSMPNS